MIGRVEPTEVLHDRDLPDRAGFNLVTRIYAYFRGGAPRESVVVASPTSREVGLARLSWAAQLAAVSPPIRVQLKGGGLFASKLQFPAPQYGGGRSCLDDDVEKK